MKYLTFLLWILLCTISVQAEENDMTERKIPVNYAQNKAAREFMYEQSKEYGFDSKYLISLLMSINRDNEVLTKISRPAEKTMTWGEYKTIFGDESRLKNGISFYHEHQKALQEAYERYGVDPSIIVAIIGVETRYGKVTGKTPVLQSLATLCFDYPKRSDFFCSELSAFLRLAQQQNWNPLQVEGSYAGAMGMAQFMPSSYLNDAIDFNNDKSIDFWQQPEDAIGSIAHYLKNRGWRKDGSLYHKLRQKPALPSFNETHKPHFSLKTLADDKILQKDKLFMEWLAQQKNEDIGGLILEDNNATLPLITYRNFYVITRYNSSPLYAMAVSNLAENIKKSSENEVNKSKNE